MLCRRRNILLIGLAAALTGCGGSGDRTHYKSAESSVNSALVIMRAWKKGDIPSYFAADAIDGEIRFLSSLTPALDGDADLPIALLQRARKAMEHSDDKTVDNVLPDIAAAAQSIHAAAAQ